MRGLLILAAVLVGSFSVARSLAETFAPRDVALAHRLAPGDGRIAARLAASLAGLDATRSNRRRADELAHIALRQEPTAVSAVSALGINAQVRGNVADAQRLFAYSQKLSRRDFQTQLWAIEDAVGRGDVAGALRHYDITLRVTPAASDLLYPVLASASADPAIRAALIRTLVGKPPWGNSFIDHVAGNGPDPRSTSQLFLGLRAAGVSVPETARAGAVNALLAGGNVNDAWRYFASTRPGADRRMSRDPRFTDAPDAPSLLDWTPVNDTGITTSIQRGDPNGTFEFAASASVGGPLLQQLQLLPQGVYRIEGHSIGIDQLDAARPYWLLRCQDGRELGRVVMPNSGRANGVFAGQFHVPPTCPVQTLVLIARSSDAISGLSGQIDRVRVSPVR